MTKRHNMVGLKLEKLPDRMPVKLTIMISPALNVALGEYARIYGAYGAKVPIAALAPAMLEAFLDGDRAFEKALSMGIAK